LSRNDPLGQVKVPAVILTVRDAYPAPIPENLQGSIRHLGRLPATVFPLCNIKLFQFAAREWAIFADCAIDHFYRSRVFPVQALFPALFPSLPTRRHERAEVPEGFDGNGTQLLVPVFKTETLSVNEIERLPRACSAHASLDDQVVVSAKYRQRIELDQA